MRKKEKVSAVVYDLDGTVLDSSGKKALQKVKFICARHCVAVNEKKLVSAWGLPIEQLFEQGLGVSRALAEEIAADWREMDRRDPPPLVEGAYETIEENARRGIRNFILTSRTMSSVNNVLVNRDLFGLFEDVLGDDGCSKRVVFSDGKYPAGIRPKPDPHALRSITEYLWDRYNIGAGEVVFVGDTESDVKCGLGAGVETLAVLTGMMKKKDFTERGIGEENVIPSVAHLHKWIMFHRNGHEK